MQRFSPKPLLPAGFPASVSVSWEVQGCPPQGAAFQAHAFWVSLRTPGGDPGTWPFTHTSGYSKLAPCHLRFNSLKAGLEAHFCVGLSAGVPGRAAADPVR